MTSPREPFERLKAADPARARQPAHPNDADAQEMYRRIVTPEPETRTARRRWRRIPLVVGAALLMAAAGYLLTRPVTEPLTVGCYRSASLDADRIVLPASTDVPPDELCRTAWQPGGEFAIDADGQAPPLTACVLDSGTIGVFPSADTDGVCEQLGIAPPDEADPDRIQQDDTQQIIELQDALVPRFLDACLDLPTATGIVEDELRQRGLSDWQVTNTQPFTADRPCASLAIEPTTQTIELVPISP